MDASLTTHRATAADLRHLNATLDNLRRDTEAAADMLAYAREARDALAASPDDPEAAHRLRMTELRMRGDAAVLAHHFAALALPAEG